MKHHFTLPHLDWVKRVNRTWIVQGDLNAHAEAWLEHLAALGDGRLDPSCHAARIMCGLRNPTDDPKPWFYAGLFSLATAEEAKQYLDKHRVTKATVASMEDDEAVKLWIDRIGPETLDLLKRLRENLALLREGPPVGQPV